MGVLPRTVGDVTAWVVLTVPQLFGSLSSFQEVGEVGQDLARFLAGCGPRGEVDMNTAVSVKKPGAPLPAPLQNPQRPQSGGASTQ